MIVAPSPCGLDAFVHALAHAVTLDAVWTLLRGTLKEAGFGAIGYLMFDGGLAGEAAALLEEGYDPAVVHAFAALGYGRNAPLVRIALASGRPMLASQAAENHRLSREEQSHREAMLGAGLTEALALPVYGPGGKDGIMLLSEPATPSLYEPEEWMALHACAQIAHLRGFAVGAGDAAVPVDLSARELEILRWVAQGKSNGVISEILGISGGTVDTYLRRLFEKLDVSDRTSAAVRGVSLGLIRA